MANCKCHLSLCWGNWNQVSGYLLPPTRTWLHGCYETLWAHRSARNNILLCFLGSCYSLGSVVYLNMQSRFDTFIMTQFNWNRSIKRGMNAFLATTRNWHWLNILIDVYANTSSMYMMLLLWLCSFLLIHHSLGPIEEVCNRMKLKLTSPIDFTANHKIQ